MKDVLFRWEGEWARHLSEMVRLNLDDPRAVRRVAQAVKRLSERFTGRSAGDRIRGIYGNRRMFREGYGAYYLAVNVPKHVYLYDRYTPLKDVSRILDIGCGPGTAVIGWLLAQRDRRTVEPVSVTLLDKSVGFLKEALRNIRIVRDNMSVHGPTVMVPWSVSRETYRCETRFPLAVISNLLGEIPGTRLSMMIRQIEACVAEDGYLLMVEPALRPVSRRLLQVRDRLVSHGFRVLGPCPGSYPCPALKTPEDWCHHRLPWNPPPFVKTVDHLAGLNKKHLNFSYCILIRRQNDTLPALKPDDTTYLVVSDKLKRFGGTFFYVCSAGVRKGVVLMKKNLRENNREFLMLKRYDLVDILYPEEGEYLKIGPETLVRRVKNESVSE